MSNQAPSFVLVAVDPGAIAGVVAMRFWVPELVKRRSPPPPAASILAGKAVVTEDLMANPSLAGCTIACEALLYAEFYDAVVLVVEMAKGMVKANVATYGAQRETIGAIRATARLRGLPDIIVAPSSAKLALTGSGQSQSGDKDAMVTAVRGVQGWERLLDSRKDRHQAKADAVGIGMAGAQQYLASLAATAVAR